MSLNKLGRYDIIRVLGKGAMGLVYEARDPNLDRRVAIKTIKVENLSEEAAAEYEARFRTEARSAARLQHPNIVSVYDSDRHGDMAFLVMEFIQGEDLKHHLDAGRRYSLEQSLGMVRDLLSALDYAHRQSIVHRDVKPANLLIEADGRVKLTDFGVARIQDSGEATRTQGSMVGTLKYMSPEQVQGVPIDARADLFAVGVVLYQLLTGKRPFDGDTDFAIIQQIVGHVPAAPSTFNTLLPQSIDVVMARALAKKREERFATAQEFSQALLEASGQASDPTIVPPVSPPGRRNGVATDTGKSRAGGSTVRLASAGTDTGSTVTQELELVYWKDIKDSEDLEDLEGFLDKFPSGIYADLARRRLRKLGGAVLADGSGTGSTATATAVSSEEIGEWTRLQGLHAETSQAIQAAASAAVAAPVTSEPVASTPPVPDAEESDLTWQGPVTVPLQNSPAPSVHAAAGFPPGVSASTVASAAPPAGRSRLLVAVLAGAGVLVLAGVAFQWSAGEKSPAAKVSTDVTLPATATTVNAPAAATAAPSPATQPASASAKPAGKRQVPVVAEKPAVGKPVAARTTAEAAVAATGSETAGSAPAAHPKQACENRVLLGFQFCMNEQCAKPAFSKHPACMERLTMEKRRREAEETRN